MSDVIISVEKLSKRYKLGQIGATTLRDSVERWWHSLRGKQAQRHLQEGWEVREGAELSNPATSNLATEPLDSEEE